MSAAQAICESSPKQTNGAELVKTMITEIFEREYEYIQGCPADGKVLSSVAK